MNTSQKLSDIVAIAPYYQRSVLISDDFESSDALSGYVCHESAKNLLENMSSQLLHTKQRAFTWTGPFGTGKSILSLALASAVGLDYGKRYKAKKALDSENIRYFDEAFSISNRGWLILPIVGTSSSVIEVLSEAVLKATGLTSNTSTELLSNLRVTAESEKFDGVMLVIDEMGKFLERSESSSDIFFFQEVAELSSRVKGNFVLIGILHQSFKQYAKTQKMTEQTQNEWAKVQGRFVDLPFVTSSDEVVRLISNAICCTEKVDLDDKISERVCASLSKRKPGIAEDLPNALESCWPLHPITTLLLGPASKRQFGQNERSIFGFLGSLEPSGFQEFLRESSISRHVYYTPEKYWDYLKSNVEPAITSSLDSHRWGIAVDALERVEAKGGHLHASLIKNIAVIDLFKNGTGLAPDNDLLMTLYPEVMHDEVACAISDLESWKTIVYRKFNEAWSIFEGSDFDIEHAIAEELKKSNSLELQKISEITYFHPVIAKKHLYQTGTSRWMGVAICSQDNLVQHVKRFQPTNGKFGEFIFLINAKENDLRQQFKNISNLVEDKKAAIVLGCPQHSEKIVELARELVALEAVSDRPELDGDQVARKEVSARSIATQRHLEIELVNATNKTLWLYGDRASDSGRGCLSKIASDLADRLFFDAPRIHSELVNRDALSTSSVKARKDLLYKMLSSEGLESLGIEGFPAEKGLYLTCLNATGIHQAKEGSTEWYLSSPAAEHRNLLPAWQAALDLIINEQNSVPCQEIYELWAAPPYGIKSGLMPILLWALLLSNKDRLALYKEGFYLPAPKEIDIDVSLQNIGKFEVKGVELTDERFELLKAISSVLDAYFKQEQLKDPLSVARGLVQIIFSLSGWVKKTRDLSYQSMRFRDCILKASDPHKVLFHELKVIFKTEEAAGIASGIRLALEEITSKQGELAESLSSLMFEQLNVPKNNLISLKARASNVQNTGSPIVNAFISRLHDYDGSEKSIFDAFGLLAEKPFENWGDQDVQYVKNKFASIASEFRELEVIAQVNQRPVARQALALVYGSSPGRDFVTHFDMFEDERSKLSELSNELIRTLSNSQLGTDAQLAVIAQTLEALYKEEKENSHG